MRTVFLRDLTIEGSIGVFPHEHGRTQRLRINVELGCADDAAEDVAELGAGPIRDELSQVVDYATLADRVRATVAAGHVKLVETLAERIAEAAFFDPRVRRCRVRVEKLDVFADVGSVGVEIERHRRDTARDLSTSAD